MIRLTIGRFFDILRSREIGFTLEVPMRPDLTNVPLEQLLTLWSREDLNEHFGHDPMHEEAPTRAELDAAIATAQDEQTEEEPDDLWLTDDNLDEEEPSLQGWTTLSDEEIKASIRRICRSAKTDQEVQSLLRDELGYPYGAAIASMSSGRNRCTSVMLHGPRGNILSI
ncbi:MAG: hypothetical protein NUV84_03200 [Candidatus Uhrbacteria bacterium]|nr:hypothetical protein [Candidatus Uhrbacteria bacterium]